MTFERSRSSNVLSIPVAGLIAWLLWDTVDLGLLLAWLAFKVATTGARLAVAHGFEWAGPAHAARYGRWLCATLALDGLAYGLIVPLVAPAGDTVLTVVMTASVIGIAAIGLVVLSMSLAATLVFVVPVISPAFPVLIARGDDVSLYLAAGMAVFLGLVAIEGARASAHTRAMLRLRFRMDELAAQRAQALDEAERGNAVKSRFLATMSHEMRTPLHGILGLARLLRDPLADRPEGAERLRMLERTGEHLLDLINDVLDHSRIEDRRVELAAERFDLRALLHALPDTVRVAADEKGLDLRTDLAALGDGDAPVWVTGDPARLRQIVLNLLGNAVKFTARGHVTLRAARGGAAVVVDVVDTGIGVADADRERIFEAFEQGDNSFTRRHGGTGLGLTIARELARAMQGDLRCLGNPGGGSVFRLTLSLPSVAPVAVPAPHDAPRPLLRGRVLLAEDNPVNALVAQAALERLGLEVVVATDGRAAVDRAEGGEFALILMDAQMPELDGFEAAARIRASEQARGASPTPIVALTANALPSDRARSLAAGMDDHLAKPFSDADLVAVLQRYLAPVPA